MEKRKAKSRRRERRELAHQWAAAAEHIENHASKFFCRLKRFVKRYPRCRRVLLFIRVSGDKQWKAGSHEVQRAALEQAAKRYGLEVVDVIIEVHPGKRLGRRATLIEAIEVAQRNRAFILAYSACRLRRSERHTPTGNYDLLPTEAEYQELADMSGGVRLVTLLDPELPPREVTSRITREAKRLRGNPGGPTRKPRPGDTKRRKEAWQPIARELYARRLSYQSIADVLNARGEPFRQVSKKTVGNWINAEERVV